ncbi:MAG TPA: aldehyde ferredoxin oxidoreductase N-terminal domain-containing protein [Dehalococcoidales bacterium]|nr:aldehyde ferredoxin oxidoreductase N-terminal domain-containing protein [Dehalococcoidales bacterium]
MAKSYGWTGSILWVDLTNNRITRVPTSDFEPEKFIGGVGLNTRIFWELGSPKVDAFHPDSPLLISVGPLTGASGPFNRAEVCGIAPQCYPEELFAYSGFGGKFPSELKYAGYDGIVILGKADRPVYLSIHNDDVELKDARHLWGVDTFETQQTLMSSHPRASVLTIGPAGENLSRLSIILNETASAAGQGGYGAVMGSKNLKAIVVRGTGSLKIARPDDFLGLVSDRMAAGEWLSGAAQSWGRYPLCGEVIKADMQINHLKKFAGCYGCPYQCMGFYDIPGIGKGAQMCVEAWYGYFTRDSSEGYWEGNILSQKLGINNYELLGMMIFLTAAVGYGAASKKDLGLSTIPQIDYAGQRQYGGQKAHHKFLTELLNGIADGTSLLSQGVGRAAEQLGQRAVDLYQERYPARGYTSHHIENVGSALHWATDTRDPYSSCHDYVFTFGPYPQIAAHFGVPGGDMTPGGKKNVYERTEDQTAWVQNHQSLKNSLPICEYASIPYAFYHPPAMDIRIFESQVLSAVTGIDYSVDKLWEAGERIWALRRAIMVLRENRTREDDTLSHVWFEQIAGGDQTLAAPLDRDQWEALKDRYYGVRGWDVSTGWPARARLEELGMKDVADTLQSAGKLGQHSRQEPQIASAPSR